MAQNSSIEWTQATWNPTVGCSLKSPECFNCYAMLMAHRLAKMGQAKYQGLTRVIENGKHKGKIVWNGTVRLDRDSLDIPHDRKKPTLYFTDSMSDLFHAQLSDSDISEVWSTMVVTDDRHRYQVLTKCAERMRDFVNGWINHMRAATKEPVRNIWLGVSCGYKPAKKRIDALRETNAAVRFLSCEPLIEDLGELDLSGIHWVIAGGESGPRARPCNIEWIRNIVRQCRQQKVPVFVKQLGAKPYLHKAESVHIEKPGMKFSMQSLEINSTFKLKDPKGGDMSEWPKDLQVREYPNVREVAHASVSAV
jgi:protein gp37